MTVVKISKQKVINAIKKEPLSYGYWYSRFEFDGFISINQQKNCSVCAVGAVMKNIIDPMFPTQWIGDVCNYVVNDIEKGIPESCSLTSMNDVLKQVKNKKYMSALSMFFEMECNKAVNRVDYPLSRHQIYRIRQKTIRFVKENFPSKIQIDIDGASPAKDVKVVKQ